MPGSPPGVAALVRIAGRRRAHLAHVTYVWKSAVECVDTAALDDGHIAVRNSNHPEAGVVFFTPAEMAAWINGCKSGEFDDLA